jgi:Pyridoxamine 5'-phosphate oxidase
MNQQQIMEIFNDPLSQELLHSNIPARMAYTGDDGFPRAIAIGFYWNGTDFIMATHPKSPKVSALTQQPKVALTIDTNSFPPHVLTVRGAASIEVVEGVPWEYLEASRKFIAPEQWQGFEANVRATYKQMARIAVAPEWAQVYDFVTRAPKAIQS